MGDPQSVSGNSVLTVVLICLFVVGSSLPAQELQATRLELRGPAWDGTSGGFLGTRETIPLVLGTTSPVPQPIRFIVGAGGSERAAEISGQGESWFRGPIAIGRTTGPIPTTLVRLADVPDIDGTGLQVDLFGTESSTGVRVQNIGLGGSEHAGILLMSRQNGIGTGIRIGGGDGTQRPTLQTGIEITGGTGIRYNALTAGNGTAIEIGGTTSPQRGVDVRVSGGGQSGVFSRANTLGTGLIGMSASGSYPDVLPEPNVAILGVSSSNSNALADTLIGVRAHSARGGSGSQRMVTLGCYATASVESSRHAGTAIGLLAESIASSPGVSVAIGGAFSSGGNGYGVAVLRGDVFLGSDPAYVPDVLLESAFSVAEQNTTHVAHLTSSGMRFRRGAHTVALATGVPAVIDVGAYEVVRVNADQAGSEVDGLTGESDGRGITLVNVDGPLILHDEGLAAPVEQRMMLPGDADVVVPPDGVVHFWYDAQEQRWRLTGRNW